MKLVNLTQLALNDASIAALPNDIGRSVSFAVFIAPRSTSTELSFLHKFVRGFSVDSICRFCQFSCRVSMLLILCIII